MNEKTFSVICRDENGDVIFDLKFMREGVDEDQGKDMRVKYLERLHGLYVSDPTRLLR